LKRDIRTKSGSALFDFILADLQELKRIMFDPQSRQVYMSAIEATWWLNDQLQAWLGEKNAADTLTQSVPHNVTSEMGLALLDVADVIRPHPDVVAFLQRVEDEGFLDEMVKLEGGREARDAIRAYLDKYGMRCVGEIDITRPRWSERPTTLVPVILGNVKNFEPGAAEQRYEQGRQEAWAKEQAPWPTGQALKRLRISSKSSVSAWMGSLRGGRGFLQAPQRPVSARCWAPMRFFWPQFLQVVITGIWLASDLFIDACGRGFDAG